MRRFGYAMLVVTCALCVTGCECLETGSCDVELGLLETLLRLFS